MKQEQSQYLSIYNAIVTQICIGTFQKGDRLGTAEEMCRQYQVGITTIRRVRKLLQDNQYISSCRGRRSPVVIFDISDSTNKSMDPLISLYQKKKAIICLYQSLSQLMPYLLAQGASVFPDEQILSLESCIQSLDKISETGEYLIRIISEFMNTILSSLKNPFITDFRKEVLFFQLIPFHIIKQSRILEPRISLWRDYLGQIIESVKQKDVLLTFQLTRAFYLDVDEIACGYLEGLADVPDHFNHLPFQWLAGKNDTHRYWKVVFQIAEKIDRGIYREQEFLPSIAKLAKEYQLSEITIRNSLSVLRECGIVETINGVGTKVVQKAKWKDRLSLDHLSMRESVWRYLYTLQFLVLICIDPASYAADHITESEIQALDQFLAERDEKERYRLGAVRILDLVILHSPNAVIQNMLEELRKMLYWGYCLYFCRKFKVNRRLLEQFSFVLNSLRSKKKEEFALQLGRAFNIMYDSIRNILIAEGAAAEGEIPEIQIDVLTKMI